MAIIPELNKFLKADKDKYYKVIGQHGAADYWHVIRQTRPAKPEEYTELLDELVICGHSPYIICRAGRQHHDHREKAARFGVLP